MSDLEASVRSPRSRGMWVLCTLALVVVFVLSLATPSVAQITTATVVGTVTDNTGAVVGNAQVTITNPDTDFTRATPTNSSGQYRFELLPIGNYVLDVTASGFKKFVQQGIVLTVNQVATVDVTLAIGSISETVNVTGAAPTVNTSNAEIGTTVNNGEVENLPIVNRNVYTLLALTPGVQSSAFTDTAVGFQQQVTMINGGTDGGAGSVGYYLDGGLNQTGIRNTGNALPSPDAIQEFRVETNNYNAEYGRSAAGIINVVTKSGTNDLHGSLFEFVRNTDLNANNAFNTSTTPIYHRNQFGGTVGGPIRKNKIFFFGSYDGLRQITPNFHSGQVVPTAAEREGNFCADAAIKDPIVGGPVFSQSGMVNGTLVTCPTGSTGDIIPSSVWDASGANLMQNYFPVANVANATTGVLNEWTGDQASSPYNFDDYLGKFNIALTNNQQLTASYFFNQGTNTVSEGSVPYAYLEYTWRQQNLNLSHTWTLTPDSVNQAWISYTRNFGGRVPVPEISLSQLGTSASPNKYIGQGTADLPQIAVSGYTTLTDAISGPATGSNIFTFRDVYNWTKGKNGFEFGGEISHDIDKQQTNLDNYGVFTFAGKYSGNNLADLLLGIQSSQEQDQPVTPYTDSIYYALFVQDNLRVTSRLTLNLGVRWDVQTPPTSSNSLASSFVAGQQSKVYPTAPLGMLFPGDAGVSGTGIVDTRYHHIAPRIGIAWDPTGKGKTSIRAGAGVFYGNVSGNEWNTTSNYEPFAIRLTSWPNIFSTGKATGTYATLTNPYGGYTCGGVAASPFPYPNSSCGAFVGGGSIYGISPHFQWPYTYQFNLSIQHQFGGSNGPTFSFAYVGTLAHDLPFATDLNAPTVFCGAVTSANFSTCRSDVNDRRPIDNSVLYPTTGFTASAFGQVFDLQSNQTASYNSLQITWVERLQTHLTLNGFFTYSKNLESVELENNTANPTGTGQVPQDYLYLNEERGRTDDDIHSIFVTSFVWNSSYYQGPNRFVRAMANGWQVSPVFTLESGTPFTVTTGSDNNADSSSANDRPDFVPGQVAAISNGNLTQQLHGYFNTGAFCYNNGQTGTYACPAGVTGVGPNGQDGDVPRDILSGPTFFDVDMAIFRDFKIHEDWTLQARAEAQNAFNLLNLAAPSAGMTSSTYGQITGSAGVNREIQLGLRLTF
ncbi:MAG: carboxypeptidase regulatory-like domain-containing protein [Candidatus Acidiferrales bacterium]